MFPASRPSEGAYEYRITGEKTYELCATFVLEDSAEWRLRVGSASS
jgi:hypothetical protein